MHEKRFVFLILTLFLASCAETQVYQKPAPVRRGHPPMVHKKAPKTIETYKYPEEPVFVPEPKTEQPPQEKEPGQSAPISAIDPLTSPNQVDQQAPETNSQPEVVNQPEAVAPPEPSAPEIPIMPPVSTASFSPPILALASEADQNIQSGRYDAAVVTIERALRIDPRNAVLTYKLASIRLKQEQPKLAEDLAKKAALLAGSDRDIKKRSWLLIAESKRLQNDPEGVEKALQKAMQF